MKLLTLTFLAALASAQIPNYTITQVTATGTAPSPRPINKSAQVVFNNGQAAFLWTNGSTTGLGFAAAGGINDSGQVAGATAAPNAVIWTPATPNATTGSAATFLSVIGGGSQATGINSYGQVIGQSGYGCKAGVCSYNDSFLWTPSSPNVTTGTITADESALVPSAATPFLDLNGYGQTIANAAGAVLYTPTAPNAATGGVVNISGVSQAAAINAGGVVIGTTNGPGFVWTPAASNGTTGAAVAIPFLTGFSAMQPTAINSQGQVVGTMAGTRPFLYQNGTTYDLGTVRSDLAGATPVGINDRGQIILNANGGVYLLTPPLPPAPTGVSPAAGAGSSQTLSFSYSVPSGLQNLGVVNILINNFIDGRNACYLAYSASAKTLYLVNDAGQAGGPFAGTSTFETANTIQNSQCSVRPVSVNSPGTGPASPFGNVLTLTLAFNFQPAFAGNKIIFLAASDVTGNSSGWSPLGVWQVPGGTQTTTTAVIGMMPASASGLAPMPYTFQFSDTKGVSDLGVENILINSALDGRHACYLAYSRPFNVLYLVNDAGTALLAGQSLAAAGSINNSQCAVSWGTTAVGTSGNNLSLNLSIGFTAGFGPDLVFYLAARDINEANNTGWQASGVAVAQ